jgi:hypothetical protein
MGKQDEIEITPEMIEAASAAILDLIDAFEAERAPVLAKAALEAALGRADPKDRRESNK